jgi:hypothetical protein
VARLAELSGVVALCLVFFGVFLLVLSSVFPQGTGLRDLIGRGDPASWREERAGRLAGGGLDAGGARLTVLARGVSWKPAGQIAWGSARTGQSLRERDGVQTSDHGEAVISFHRAGEVRLGRNTMVVVRKPVEEGGGRRRSSLSVLAGELWGESVPEALVSEIQLEASAAVARIHGGASSPGVPGYKVSVSADRRTTLAVYSGSAEILAGGRTVRVAPRHYATLDSSGVVASGPLPDAPRPLAPEPQARIPYRNLPPPVKFAWSAPGDGLGYRIVLARDPAFREVILDVRTTRPEFVHGHLADGATYWRVSAFRDEAEGLPSRVRELRLVPNGGGPELAVELPQGLVRAGAWTVAGETRPGVSVFVGGAPVEVGADGRFRHEILLEPGVHVVVVEAVDPLGNTSYESRVVHAR